MGGVLFFGKGLSCKENLFCTKGLIVLQIFDPLRGPCAVFIPDVFIDLIYCLMVRGLRLWSYLDFSPGFLFDQRL